MLLRHDYENCNCLDVSHTLLNLLIKDNLATIDKKECLHLQSIQKILMSPVILKFIHKLHLGYFLPNDQVGKKVEMLFCAVEWQQ